MQKQPASHAVFCFAPCAHESKTFNAWALNKKDPPSRASPFAFFVDPERLATLISPFPES